MKNRMLTLKQAWLAKAREEDGFSLIELMVVIVIMGLLATIVVINVLPSQDRAMVDKARADVRLIEQAIELYRMDALRYPSLEEGLAALEAAPKAGFRKEGYLKFLPEDPWGKPYQYLVPGEHGAFDVFSYGADGQPGGEGLDADIGNWKD